MFMHRYDEGTCLFFISINRKFIGFFVCFVFRFGMDGLTTNTSGMMTTDLQDLSSQAVSTNPSNPADVLTAGTTVSPEDAANAVS